MKRIRSDRSDRSDVSDARHRPNLTDPSGHAASDRDLGPANPRPAGQPALARIEPSGPNYSALRSLLADGQVRLPDAQVLLKRGLVTALLRDTHPELEDQAYRWLNFAVRGSQPAQLESEVKDCIAGDSTAAAKLLEILVAQRAAIGASLNDPWRRVFEPASEAILERIAGALIEELPAASPPDSVAALASACAAGRIAGGGLFSPVAYPAIRHGFQGANSFTNEPGLPELVRKLDFAGGACVGVGGAVLDIGSMGADLIVAVDANPCLTSSIELFVAILLAVDQQARAENLDPAQRAARVLEWLTRGPHLETTLALAELGLPQAFSAALPLQLQGIADKLAGRSDEVHPIPFDLWCRGPDAPARILHLTRLALEGRIIAMTADLADPRTTNRINALLCLHQTAASVIHMSNVLDYQLAPDRVLENLAGVRRDSEAVVTACAGFHFRGAVRAAAPDDHFLIESLGTPREPTVHDARTWLNAERAARIRNAVWEMAPWIRRLIQWTQYAYRLTTPPPEVTPRTPAQFSTWFASSLERAFQNPDYGRQHLLEVMATTGRLPAYQAVGPSDWSDFSPASIPRTMEQVHAQADRFDAEFWAVPGRKEAYLRHALGALHVEDIPAEESAQCRSFDDLTALIFRFFQRHQQAKTARRGSGPGNPNT